MLPSQIILFLLDIFQNTTIRKYFNFYKKSLEWNSDEIRTYQLKRLRSLIEHAQQNVPYYKEILDYRHFNVKDLRTLDDIKYIPFLTREVIQKHKNNLVSNQFKTLDLEKNSSSGTTGIPIEFFHDKNSLSAGIAAGYFAWNLSGWLPGDKTLHIWGNPTSVQHWNKIKSKLKRRLKNQVNIASTEFNDSGNYERLYTDILKQKFMAIDGYTTAIYELAKYIEYKNLPKLNIKYVFPTAENLLDNYRILIQKNIGPVSDLYGCGEINGIAIQPLHQEKYLIIDPHVYVEIEESNDNFKSIIVTDLDNRAMPLIRYKIGDLIDNIYEPNVDQHVQFSFFKKILGRETEIINLPNGKRILPVNIVGGTLFRKIGGILKHKVVWNGSIFHFYFEINSEFNKERAQELISNEFKAYNIEVKIEIVEKLLPDKSGKFRYFEKII